jgi:hypothetical protein
MFNFNDFIEESYLDSSKDPLYHYTNIYTFYKILNDNKSDIGFFENPFLGKNIKFISLSRNPNLDFSYYKMDLDVIIELDNNKLRNNYKIIPYDYFIRSGKTNYTKSDLRRKEPFEFEEVILEDIENIKSYILSVNFLDDSILLPIFTNILPILKENKIKILKDGKEYKL